MAEIIKYLQIIRKWWWVIALLCVTTVGSMVAIAQFVEPEYEAKVTLQFVAPPPQEAPLFSEFGRQALYVEIEQNRSTFNELLIEGDVVAQAVNSLPDISINARELREDKMTVEMPDQSQLVHVFVRAQDPEVAALLAKTIVETGLNRFAQLNAQSTANTRQFIERQLDTARVELAAAEAELAQFQIDNKIGGTLSTTMSYLYDVMRALSIQRDLALAEADIVKAQAIDEIVLEHEADLQTMLGLSAEYTTLVDRVERARSNFDFLLGKRNEAQIKENQITELGFIQVITPARPPDQPVLIISSKLIILGAVASIMVGGLLTFLLEYLEISGFFRRRPLPPEQTELVVLPDHAN